MKRRPDLGQTWLNAVDQITARARTLKKLSADDRYKGRRESLIRTRGDLMMAHEVLTAVLQDFEEHLSRTATREAAPGRVTPPTTEENTDGNTVAEQG